MSRGTGRAGRPLRAAAAVLALCTAAALFFSGCGGVGESRRRAAAADMADFILNLQQQDGAIPDAPGADTVNEDSNMEYALAALAAAYRSTGDGRYLTGLERGIAWLAGVQELEGPWRGSWRFRYDRSGRPLRTAAGGASDIRGVGATSALFVYLLYLDGQCTGSAALAERYRENAAAALEFLLTKSRTEDGFMASSFIQDEAGRWSRYDCCYSADQADAWLGLQAGARLYKKDEYGRAADFLREKTPEAFFSGAYHRYCVCVEDGRQDWSEDGFAPIQSQGYLPWVWGGTAQNREAVGWLREKLEKTRPEAYSLTAAFLGLGEQGLGGALSNRDSAWLIGQEMDASGGVYDAPSDHTQTVNVAAFCALALFGQPTGF